MLLMVLREQEPTLEEVQAEWMAALDRALSGSREEWAEFMHRAHPPPEFTPEEDAEDIAFMREYELNLARGEIKLVDLPDPEDDHADPDHEFFVRLATEFPEHLDMRMDRKLPTIEGQAFVRHMRSTFPEALFLSVPP
jgi:hypothetical protein